MAVAPTPLGASRWAPTPAVAAAPPSSISHPGKSRSAAAAPTPTQLRRLLAGPAHTEGHAAPTVAALLPRGGPPDRRRPVAVLARRRRRNPRRTGSGSTAGERNDLFESHALLERALLLLHALPASARPCARPCARVHAPDLPEAVARHGTAAAPRRRRAAVSVTVLTGGASAGADAPPSRHRFHKGVLEAPPAKLCAADVSGRGHGEAVAEEREGVAESLEGAGAGR